MAKAKAGDTVKVHYTGTLDDGSVFDSSVDREPLEFTLGQGTLIPGFEEAVVGMQLDESKTATIAHEEAYGPHRPEMIAEVDRARFPDNLEPEVGQHLQMRNEQGHVMTVVVSEVSETSVTLDANHPLAGKDLTFDIELVEIA